MKRTVAPPRYNKSETIRRIVVDHNPSDGTRDLHPTPIAPRADKVIHHEINQDKGAGLRTGIIRATADVVVVQDLPFRKPSGQRIL